MQSCSHEFSQEIGPSLSCSKWLKTMCNCSSFHKFSLILCQAQIEVVGTSTMSMWRYQRLIERRPEFLHSIFTGIYCSRCLRHIWEQRILSTYILVWEKIENKQYYNEVLWRKKKRNIRTEQGRLEVLTTIINRVVSKGLNEMMPLEDDLREVRSEPWALWRKKDLGKRKSYSKGLEATKLVYLKAPNYWAQLNQESLYVDTNGLASAFFYFLSKKS